MFSLDGGIEQDQNTQQLILGWNLAFNNNSQHGSR